MCHKTTFSYIRFFNVLMRPVGTSIILYVLQNGYVLKMLRLLLLLKNLQIRFFLESHLLAPCIFVSNVNKEKISPTLKCKWQFADVVQRHIIKNVYPSKFYCKIQDLFIRVVLGCHLVSLCSRDIAFEEDEDANINQRAWEGLLVDRILIYCL